MLLQMCLHVAWYVLKCMQSWWNRISFYIMLSLMLHKGDSEMAQLRLFWFSAKVLCQRFWVGQCVWIGGVLGSFLKMTKGTLFWVSPSFFIQCVFHLHTADGRWKPFFFFFKLECNVPKRKLPRSDLQFTHTRTHTHTAFLKKYWMGGCWWRRKSPMMSNKQKNKTSSNNDNNKSITGITVITNEHEENAKTGSSNRFWTVSQFNGQQ